MAAVIAIWNGKGGAGKTSTAVCLAAELALTAPVTLIDLDPQQNATRWLADIGDGPTSLDVICGRATVAEAAGATDRHMLRVVPSSPRLAAVGVELADNPAPQHVLLDALEGFGETVVLDCPPAFAELTVAALTAATVHVLPVQPSALDLDSAVTSIDRVNSIRKRLNPTLTTGMIVVCAFDARTTLSKQTEQFAGALTASAAVVRVPADVRVRMAPGARQLLDEYAPRSPATTAYRIAAAKLKEMIEHG